MGLAEPWLGRERWGKKKMTPMTTITMASCSLRESMALS
jgi:hypothetical protein